MNKILTFIINEYNELLLLKGSPNDPQFKKSFWYVVTGGCENIDKTKEDTVIREVKEETNLNVIDLIYLNWIFEYNSLGKECTEYVYASFVNKDTIILNEENIDYKWCNIDEFIEDTDWFGSKDKLKKVLCEAINRKVYFKDEEIDELY